MTWLSRRKKGRRRRRGREGEGVFQRNNEKTEARVKKKRIKEEKKKEGSNVNRNGRFQKGYNYNNLHNITPNNLVITSPWQTS